jgi:hypothetical protein
MAPYSRDTRVAESIEYKKDCFPVPPGRKQASAPRLRRSAEIANDGDHFPGIGRNEEVDVRTQGSRWS